MLLGACTSVSWSDSSGELHHLGLVVCKTTPLSSGTRLERWVCGLDLRINGPDIGWTLGWKKHNAYAPLIKVARLSAGLDQDDYLPAAMLEDVLGPLSAETSSTKPQEWQFLYASEKVSTNATYMDAHSLGIDIRVGEVSPGLSIIYHSNQQLIGACLGPHIAHILWTDPDSSSLDHIILWKLTW